MGNFRKVRIISGKWRGYKLPVLNIRGLRPTTERVRETLFNWLMPVIQKSHCLDCFAGSGALSLEALSRGATSVTMLEQNRKISAQIINNLYKLKVQHVKVITTDSMRWLTKSSSILFNVIFIDPPFRRGMIKKTVSMLETYRHLSDNAWIYIETEIEFSTFSVPSSWVLHREKTSGQVAYRLYNRNIISKQHH